MTEVAAERQVRRRARATDPAAEGFATRHGRIVIFWYELAALAVIGWTAWLTLTDQPILGSKIPGILGLVPTGVLWFGALGGVLISLAGVHEHRYDWDPRHWTWYVARPIVGAAVAVIATITLQSGILAVGVDPTTATAGAEAASSGAGAGPGAVANGPSFLFYYLIAFVAGYREETFRSMIKRIGDVILSSKDQARKPMLTSLEPLSGAAGAEVVITGTDLSTVQMVRFGTAEAPNFRVASDTRIQAIVPPGNAGETVDVAVVASAGNADLPAAFTYDLG